MHVTLLRFLCIYNWHAFMSEEFYLHQTFTDFCILLLYTFWYVNIPKLITGYGRFSDLIAFFLEFSYITTGLKWYNCIKLFQIVCWGRSQKIKGKPTYVIIYDYGSLSFLFCKHCLICWHFDFDTLGIPQGYPLGLTYRGYILLLVIYSL